MNSDEVWNIFEKTGSIDAYMLYNRLRCDTVQLSRQEAAKHADQDRRPDYPGTERGGER